MPGISGIETCRRLRARDDASDVPVLIVTGADDRETIDLGFEAGATQYITKPLNWPLLGRLAAIEAAVRDNQTALTNEEMNGLESLVRDSLRQLLASYARIRSELSSGA